MPLLLGCTILAALSRNRNPDLLQIPNVLTRTLSDCSNTTCPTTGPERTSVVFE